MAYTPTPAYDAVRGEGGRLVPDDRAAAEVAAYNHSVALANCDLTYAANAERVRHFTGRAAALGKSPKDVVIVFIHADDFYGQDMAAVLMPGHDWQQYRDRGEKPYACGLAGREGIQRCVDALDPKAGETLRKIPGVAAVVVDHGVVKVYATPPAG